MSKLPVNLPILLQQNSEVGFSNVFFSGLKNKEVHPPSVSQRIVPEKIHTPPLPLKDFGLNPTPLKISV